MRSVSSPVLVGRDADLNELGRAFDAAAEGRPSIVVVAGEAGIGKSRLVSDFCAAVRADGGRAVVGGCLDLGEGLPYLPFVEGLRGLARSVGPVELDRLLGPARADFSRVVPELVPPEPVAATQPPDPPIPSGRLFEGVIGLLDRVGRLAPAVLAIEDVQWIDRSSRDLVTFLVRNLVSERILLVLTVRTDDLSPADPTLEWLAELSRQPRVARLDLAPLDADAVERQLEAILGERPSPEVVRDVVTRSDGNPFFAEELLAAAGSDGSAGAAIARPTLAAILGARLHHVSSTARDVLAVLAVAGRSVDERLLAAVIGVEPDELSEPLRELRDGHIVIDDPVTGTFRFRHVLLAEIAGDEVLPARRRTLHAAFATILAEHPELADSGRLGAAAELAWHWQEAGEWERARAAAIHAGTLAAEVGAHDEAHVQLERAIGLDGRLVAAPPKTERVDLLRRAADAADLSGRLPRALELIEIAQALVDPAADPEVAALLLARAGYLHWALGDPGRAVAEHRQAVALVEPGPLTPTRARLLGSLAGMLLEPGGYQEAVAIARQAVDAAVATASVAEEARARNVLGSALVGLDEVAEGLEELARSRDLAERDGPPDLVVVVHHNLALNLAQSGRLEDALATATAGREAARRSGLERRFGTNLVALAADVLYRLGRWTEAVRLTDEAFALDATGRGAPYLAAVRGRLDAGRGDAPAATRRFLDAEELGAADDPDLAGYLAVGRAEAASLDGRPEDALAIVESAARDHPGTHAAFVRAPLLATGLGAAGDLGARLRAGRDTAALAELASRAQRLADELIAITGRWADDPRSMVLGELATVELARLAGSDGEAAWADLADRLDSVSDPAAAAVARLHAAEAALRVQGIKAAPVDLVRAAHRAAVALDAEPLRAATEDVARRARISLVEAPPAGAVAEALRASVRPADGTGGNGAVDPSVAALRRNGLSNREIEVLRLVAAGRTNGEIAERLYITRKTAGVHVTHILDKLGVSNRVEAAMVAARLGLDPGAGDG